ncbi:MAG TPA: SAM-dependent methyltransferase [Streptosporangiaceae bacterium]|nr:SAM-dependent methyltransferase [Streptosporangiaceae bacterium]
MTDSSSGGQPWNHEPPLPSRRDFDTTVAHPARVWDYWLGGKDNFAADREAGEQVIAAMPSVDASARAGRTFLATAVHYLAAGMGIRQFLDIGTGLPTANNTHEVAQQVGPESRIVYVDNDPIVLTHARALLTSDARGATAYVDADLRDTGKILAEARNVLDFSRPVALMLLHVLHFIPDRDDPYELVAKLTEPLASGSYLVLAHTTGELGTPGMQEAADRYNQTSSVKVTLRNKADVARFFDGMDLVEPGITPVGVWRPGPMDDIPDHGLSTYTAVGRKP